MRAKLWTILATVLTVGMVFASGCATLKIPLPIPGIPGYGLDLDNIPRIIVAVLNEALE